MPTNKQVIGDNRTKSYYPSDCSGKDSVPPVRRTVFKNKEEAEKAGYTLSKIVSSLPVIYVWQSNTESLDHVRSSLMLKEFKEFVARANVLDLAIALVIGAAFGKIVTSLVEGIIMPPIGLLIGKIDFASLFYVLDYSKGQPISLADAKAKGIPVMAYGALINDIVNFIIVAFVIFLIIQGRQPNAKSGSPAKKDCPQCLTAIPIAATRCAACCTDLQPA
jgi:large conductance mechanosensitive channel